MPQRERQRHLRCRAAVHRGFDQCPNRAKGKREMLMRRASELTTEQFDACGTHIRPIMSVWAYRQLTPKAPPVVLEVA